MATSTLPAMGNYASGMTIHLNDNAGTIKAYGFDDMFPSDPTFGTAIAPSSGATPKGLTVQHDLGGTTGLGVNNIYVGQDNGYIAPNDAVVLDFSSVNTTATSGGQTGSLNQITFNLYEDRAGTDYEVYGLVSGTINTSSAVWAWIASGVMSNRTPLTVPTTALYNAYAIGVTDCALDIQGVQLQYAAVVTSQTPEPGTFVMAGMALIGLGVTMKRRGRKS